jgi:hypothetical protein
MGYNMWPGTKEHQAHQNTIKYGKREGEEKLRERETNLEGKKRISIA